MARNRALIISGLLLLHPTRVAVCEEVAIHLLGTTTEPATRIITVGPDVLGCLFCSSQEVVDVDLTEELAAKVLLPREGGIVHGFVYVEILDKSAGVKSFVFDIISNRIGATFAPTEFDVVFQDTPGRTTEFIGMPAGIPAERPFSGKLTTTDEAWFFQTVANWQQAFPGSPGPVQHDIAAGGDALTQQIHAHTMGVGIVGNDQTSGPTAVARFSVDVPPLSPENKNATYQLSINVQSLITYTADPILGPPIPPAEFIIENATVTSNLPLTIVVGDSTAPFGDCDSDGDVDLVDFGSFQICFTGPTPAIPIGPQCACVDDDADGDVDLLDFGAFQLAFGGAASSNAFSETKQHLSSPIRDQRNPVGKLRFATSLDGDCDDDGDIDMADYAMLELCFTTDGSGPIDPQCACVDLDTDDDIDLADFDTFKTIFTGPAPP